MIDWPHPSTPYAIAIALLCWGFWYFTGVWRDRALKAEAAIRKHRDQRGGDRCWMDDADLYRVLPDSPNGPLPQVFEVGDKAAMLKECEHYIQRRCFEGGTWKSNAEWEAEAAALRNGIEKIYRQISQQLEHGALWTEHGTMLTDWRDQLLIPPNRK